MPVPPIIQQLAPIKNLGVFKDCKIADAPRFLQYNLIYGFNGSGKTTLSRIFASLETGALRRELPKGGTFEVHLSDGTVIKSSEALDALKGRMLVFDVDFIEESFKWKEGTARPVFYLGREQTALAEELVKTSSAVKELDQTRTAAEALNAEKDRTFVQYKRDAARLIAEQLGIGRRYDASNLAVDYARGPYGEAKLIAEKELLGLRAILTQESALPKRDPLNTPALNLTGLIEETRELAITTFGSMALEDLRDHEAMRDWITVGVKYHQEKNLGKCLFCANDLTQERLDLLRQVIDDRFEQLKNRLEAAQIAVRSVQKECALLSGSLPSSNDLSQSVRTDFSFLATGLSAALGNVERVSGEMLSVLVQKSSSPHLPVSVASVATVEDCARLEETIKKNVFDINALLTKHNAEFDDFDQAKTLAGARLKEHYLAEGQRRYSELEAETKMAQTDTDKLARQIRELKEEEERLRRKVRQHGPAAEVINKLIHNYLGRKEIELVTREDGYQLSRNGKPVDGSLSEGEKTAVSLCYFLSTLEAEGRKRKDLIVVIDDPVSSLDTKALNYAFSILKSALGEAGQLFLLTHNLNFMNEAKKWLRPKTEKEAARRNKPGTGTATLLFLDAVQVGGADSRSTTLKELPRYIREYESEYHYLFYLVLQFVEAANDDAGHFYLIPNALRKLMDIFLAFKLPGSAGLTSKIEALVKEGHGLDAGRVQALERLAQVESHADSMDDLVTFSSMTVEEAKDAAATLFALMDKLDSEHLKRMRSICKAN